MGVISQKVVSAKEDALTRFRSVQTAVIIEVTKHEFIFHIATYIQIVLRIDRMSPVSHMEP